MKDKNRNHLFGEPEPQGCLGKPKQKSKTHSDYSKKNLKSNHSNRASQNRAILELLYRGGKEMKKAALIFLTILVATTAMAQKPNHKLTDAERHAIQRYNDSLAVIADRNQLRADIQYRDFLLADSSQLRRLTPAEVRLFIDTQVTQSRTMLYMEEQWFRQNYGVSCGGVDEAYKQ